MSQSIIRATLVLVVAGFSTVVSQCVRAADQTIEMFRSTFLPQSVTIEVGDTVTWLWVAGEHTVTSGRPDGEVGTPDEPGLLFDVEITAAKPSFSYRFDSAEEPTVLFFDRRDAGDPKTQGIVQISRGEKEFRVGVVDNVFIPDDITIFAGDSIRWEHEFMEGFHTVTSGRSSRPEDDPGALFDEESSDAIPIFVYEFSEAGEYLYFCRPHESLGMTGIVRVQETFVRGDATADGEVTITDAIATLNHLFLVGGHCCCDDALDGNDDGEVNLSDPIFVLNFLFLGGERISRPFPARGADRTEDPLRCWSHPDES